jgi:hypothetical protein
MQILSVSACSRLISVYFHFKASRHRHSLQQHPKYITQPVRFPTPESYDPFAREERWSIDLINAGPLAERQHSEVSSGTPVPLE